MNEYLKKRDSSSQKTSLNSESSNNSFFDNRNTSSNLSSLQVMANESSFVNKTSQLQTAADNFTNRQDFSVQRKENTTGVPDNLKNGMENLSGYSMDDIKVHRNSDKPKDLNAHAYAQGSEIHLGPGQEKHLAHELAHVVQQKQGRVQPTKKVNGNVNVNDNAGLEKEADIMGQKALQMKSIGNDKHITNSNEVINPSIQMEPAIKDNQTVDEL